MELANIMLKLGGHDGNTIPKTAVTPSEVAVLQIIHGNESVTEIAPYGRVDRSHRNERARLLSIYGRHENGKLQSKPIDQLFPGVAASLYETFDELELPSEMFKAVGRAGGVDADARAAVEAEENKLDVGKETVHPLDHDGDGRKGGSKKGGRKKAAEPAPEPLPEVPDSAPVVDDDAGADGIGDMPPVEGRDGALFE